MKLIKSKNIIHILFEKMQIYCSRCKKYTDNTCPEKQVMITNKKIKGKTRCAGCMTIRSFFDKVENKYGLQTVAFQVLIN